MVTLSPTATAEEGASFPATGQSTPLDRPCPSDEEADGACERVPAELDVDVETPGLGPNDRVFSGAGGAYFYPLHGRVHDCAAFGTTLAVVTGEHVSLLAGGKER